MCACALVCLWTGEPLSALCANKTAAPWDTGHPRSNSITLLKYYPLSKGRGSVPHVGCVCSCVPACVFMCVLDGESVNSSTCVYSTCCRRLDSPFTIVCISSLSAGAAIDPPGGALEMWTRTSVCCQNADSPCLLQIGCSRAGIGCLMSNLIKIMLLSVERYSCSICKRKRSAPFWCLFSVEPKTPAAQGAKYEDYHSLPGSQGQKAVVNQ